jgi:hypothetical protein
LNGPSARGVWRLTEKGQATQLTYAHAQEIFRKQVKIDAASGNRGRALAHQMQPSRKKRARG